jgi:hypothetical protein
LSATAPPENVLFVIPSEVRNLMFAPFALHVNQPGSPQVLNSLAVAFTAESCG